MNIASLFRRLRAQLPMGALLAVATPIAVANVQALAPCRLPGIESQLMCGTVDRALDESKPQGKRINVKFAVLPSVARNKLPDPVILFAGGPGQSGLKLGSTASALFARLKNRRDVIVFDQRGVGQSMGLGCASDPRESLSTASDMGRLSADMVACKTKLKAKHGLSEEHFTHFTTIESSRDVDAIRAALGVEQFNLVGGSYGTRAALDYQRQFPTRVRRMVLDGVAPPDMVLPPATETDAQAALDAVFKACEARPACNARYPKLSDALKTALDRLPISHEVVHPVTLQREKVTLTRAGMTNAIRLPMYSPAHAQALPFAITQAAAGDFGPWLGLGGSMGSGTSEMAWGMHFSVICAEDFPRIDSVAASTSPVFAGVFTKLYRDVCAQWPQAAVAPEFFQIKVATQPVLVFSGGADPVTPSRHGERVTKALGPLARHVVVSEAGHGIMAVGCARDVIFQFVNAKTDDAALAVDAQCLSKIPRPLAYSVPLPSPIRLAASSPAASGVSP